MKQTLLLLLLLFPLTGTCQTGWNHGGTRAKNYLIELPYEEIGGLLVVEASIMGKQGRFLFDTGAPTAIYNDKEEEFSGAEKLEAKDSQGISKEITRRKISEITLENISFFDIPAGILPPDFLSECLLIDGIIGSNLLRNSLVQFDAPNKIIRITDHPDNFDLKRRHRQRLYLNKQSSPFLYFKIRGSQTFARKIALFDSGFTGLLDLPEDELKVLEKETYSDIRKGYGASSFGIFGASGPDERLRLKLKMVEVGPLELKEEWVHGGATKTAKLGAQLIKKGKLTLDYLNKKYYLEPYSSQEPREEKLFGFTLVPSEDKVIVGVLWEGFPSGPEVGDELLMVNGQPIEKNRCLWLFHNPVKELDQASFTFKSKGGTTYHINLNRQK